MTDTPAPTKNLPLKMGVGVVALIAVWSGIWYFAAGQSEARLQHIIEKHAARGITMQCDNRKTGGYPFRFEIECSTLTLGTTSNASEPRTLSFQNVHAVTQVYTPNHWIVEATGRALLQENGKSRIDADAALYQTSFRQVAGGINFSFSAKNVKENVWRLPKLAQFELHARPIEGAPDSAEFAVTGLGEGNNPLEFVALLHGQFAALLRSPMTKIDVAKWARASGTINVKTLLLRTGTLEATSTGTLQVNEEGRVLGTLPATIDARKTTVERKKNLFPTAEQLVLLTMGISSLPDTTSIELREDGSQIGTLPLPALPKLW